MNHSAPGPDYRATIATILSITAATWLHGLPAMAGSEDRAQLEAAAVTMDNIDEKDIFRTDSWRPDEDDILAAIAEAQRCQVTARAMSKAGNPSTMRITIPESLKVVPGYHKEKRMSPDGRRFRGWRASAPLDEFARYCARYEKLAHRALIQPYLVQHASNIARHTKKLEAAIATGQIDMSNAVVIGLDRDRCIAHVDGAIADRVPPTTAIELDRAATGLPETLTLTLASARGAVCGQFDALIDRAENANQAAIEARLAPYVQAFGGKNNGRFKALVEYKLSHLHVRGPGKKSLDTPRDLARARRWYVVRGTTGTLLHPRWNLRVFRFRGARFTVRDISGRGTEPPRRAFR